jgi:hypothetical protein
MVDKSFMKSRRRVTISGARRMRWSTTWLLLLATMGDPGLAAIAPAESKRFAAPPQPVASVSLSRDATPGSLDIVASFAESAYICGLESSANLRDWTPVSHTNGFRTFRFARVVPDRERLFFRAVDLSALLQVQGRVIDAEGSPIAAAKVRFDGGLTVTSDATGVFTAVTRVRRDSNDYFEARVEAEGFRTGGFLLSAGRLRGQLVSIPLERGEAAETAPTFASISSTNVTITVRAQDGSVDRLTISSGGGYRLGMDYGGIESGQLSGRRWTFYVLGNSDGGPPPCNPGSGCTSNGSMVFEYTSPTGGVFQLKTDGWFGSLVQGEFEIVPPP